MICAQGLPDWGRGGAAVPNYAMHQRQREAGPDPKEDASRVIEDILSVSLLHLLCLA